jgi:hypothetical protein
MDGRGAGFVGHGEEFIGIEIGADAEQGLLSAELAGQDTVLAVPVGLGEERHERMAKLLAGLHDPDGDLTAVGDEYLMVFRFAWFLHVCKSLFPRVVCWALIKGRKSATRPDPLICIIESGQALRGIILRLPGQRPARPGIDFF